jgi:ADP-ribose pyrophosphatase YjhB (NUDIX family)
MTTPRTELIEALLAAVGDRRRGLPEDVFHFASRLVPLVNVDLLIQDDRSRTLLTWRHDELYGPAWHVPGSVIRYKESAAHRIAECARAELGAEVAADPAVLHVAEAITDRETRGHHVSLLYRCRLVTPLDESRRAVSDPPSPGEWRWHAGCPPDLLDEQRDYARFF